MTKADLITLIACIEAVKVAPEAMVHVGIAWQNATAIKDRMQDGDVLIIFTPNGHDGQPGEANALGANEIIETEKTE